MSALLTPQGKLLHDFLITAEDDTYLIDCAGEQAEALLKRLSLYKLRANIELAHTDLQVHALWQEDGFPCPPMAGFAEDPRHQGLGVRGIFDAPPEIALPQSKLADWHSNRLALGVPEGPTEMPPGSVFPLEFGLQHMQAVDFKKGCFIGQEVTSRTHRKGSLRKKLRIIELHGSAQTGDDIMAGPRLVGHIVAIAPNGSRGLGLVREDAIELPLTSGAADISLRGGLFDMQDTQKT